MSSSGAAAAAAANAAAAAAANAATAVAEAEARARAEAERLRQRIALLQGRVRETEYRLAAYEGPPPPTRTNNSTKQQQQQQWQGASPGAGALASVAAWASSLLCRLGFTSPPHPGGASAVDGYQNGNDHNDDDHERRRPLLSIEDWPPGDAEAALVAAAAPQPPPPPPPPPQSAAPHAPSLMFLVEQPFLWLLSLTMPRVGAARDHRHPLWKAALLPLTAPLTVAGAYGLLPAVGRAGLLYGAGAGLVGAACLAAVYPRDHVPREPLKGAFAAATFALSVVWLNLSASALVGLAVAAGHILGLSPGLLGATVLSWGNSAPDLIGDVALARDGFPSMALAACFAGPAFSLLMGMGGALAFGAAKHGGSLSLPPGGGEGLKLMYGSLAGGLVVQLGMALVPSRGRWLGRLWWRGLEEDEVEGEGEGEGVDTAGHAVVRLGAAATIAGLSTYAAYMVAYALHTLGVV